MIRNLLCFVLSICTSIVTLHVVTSSEIALHIEPSPPVLYVAKGSALALNCTTNNTADAVTLEWSWNPQHLGGSKYILQSYNHSVQLKVNNMSYGDSGVYICTARDRKNAQAVKSIEVKVGDPPPEPPAPVLYDLCGFPPKGAFMSYVLPASPPTSSLSSSSPSSTFPYTIELLLSNKAEANTDSLDPSFQIVDKRIGILPSSKNRTFHADISSSIRALFPTFPCSYHMNINTMLDCTILCATVKVSNVFGTKYTKKPEFWDIKDEEYCGIVDQLTVLGTTKSSAEISWKSPKCMANTTIKFYFWLSCEPKCGKHFRIPSRRWTTHPQMWNYTIKSLMTYKHYKFSIICSSKRHYSDIKNAKVATTDAWTKEGVPNVAPNIKDLYWLRNASTPLQGTALVILEPLETRILNGQLKGHILTYQRLNDPKNEPVEMVLAASVRHLLVQNLKMDNYTFTIKACTGVGCGKTSRPYFLPALLAKDTDLWTNNIRTSNPVENSDDWIPIIAGVAACVGVIGLALVIYFIHRRRNAPDPFPPNVWESIDDADSQTSNEPTNNIYASANAGLSASDMQVSIENPSETMSRTSSSDTCISSL